MLLPRLCNMGVALTKCTREQAALLRDMDANGDNFISLSEFTVRFCPPSGGPVLESSYKEQKRSQKLT